MIDIRDAEMPAEVEVVRALFREYADGLGVDLCFQKFEEELAGLPGAYARPHGRIFIARKGEDVAGCVAMRQAADGSCEMKRLYVRPLFRGHQLGRLLGERILSEARGQGYPRVVLDTLPQMKEAIRLYETLGFHPIEPYYPNPVCGALFLSRNV